MPRPVRPWFRVYTEVLHDRKLRRLKPEHRWLFIACLAIARQSPQPGTLLVGDGDPVDERDIADMAAMDLRVVKAGMRALISAGVLERGSGEDPDDKSRGSSSEVVEKFFTVPAWKERQYESDNITTRTRKHRSTRGNAESDGVKERSNGTGRNVPTSFVGTPPDTETDTETENTPPPPAPADPPLMLVPAPSSPPATERSTSANVRCVFDAWCAATGRGRSKLTPDRDKLIRKQLKVYSVEDLVAAVRGWIHVPHNRGENDRHLVYNDLELLLRDAKHIERFRDLEQNPALRPRTNGQRATGTEYAAAPSGVHFE